MFISYVNNLVSVLGLLKCVLDDTRFFCKCKWILEIIQAEFVKIKTWLVSNYMIFRNRKKTIHVPFRVNGVEIYRVRHFKKKEFKQ